jgi:hypothetical protein
MKILAGLTRSFSRMFRRSEKDLNRSKLVGLYLTQANGSEGASPEFGQTRQRRNGKYSHTRERA